MQQPRSYSHSAVNKKIVLVGDVSVGKTCLFTQFNEGYFPESQATILDNFATTIQRSSGPPVRCVVWDTAGQERFRSLVGNYFNGAKAVVVVYDITCKKSFESLCSSRKSVSSWLNLVQQKCAEDTVLVIVGNKLDHQASREVTFEEGEKVALERDALFFEASAKTGENVRQVFVSLADRLPEGPAMTRDQFEDSIMLHRSDHAPPAPAPVSRTRKCLC